MEGISGKKLVTIDSYPVKCRHIDFNYCYLSLNTLKQKFPLQAECFL